MNLMQSLGQFLANAIAAIYNALSGKLNKTDVIDSLTNTSTDKPLSAAQGKALKDLFNSFSNVAIIDNLTTQDATKSLSANQGYALKNLIDSINSSLASKSNISDIINDLIHADTNKSLSAAQGKALKDLIDSINSLLANKSNISDIINDLIHTDTNKPLSAAQGKYLKSLIDSYSSTTFPSGTRLLFQQSSAPVGWTKETNASFNDAALRIVTGSVSSGGSSAFSSVFASRTPSGTLNGATGAVALTIDQIPNHAHLDAGHWHNVTPYDGGGSGVGRIAPQISPSNPNFSYYQTTETSYAQIQGTGGNGYHDHQLPSLPLSMSAMDFSVKYKDIIIATKD